MQTIIFIHTNNKQGIGALLSKFSIEKQTAHRNDIIVKNINVDDIEVFRKFSGATYLRKGREVAYDRNDLQSFTLSRFMPPELTNYTGRAIVIDPDIFAVRNIDELLDLDLEGKAIAACRKNDAWDTSMMLMDCSKLKHWKITDILTRLKNKELDYSDIMTLKTEDSDIILEVPRKWNSLDKLEGNTGLLHTTNRLTQPWRTGLPIDFTINPMPKLFGIIPREPIHKLLGKYPTHYQKHPDQNIENWFMDLVKNAHKQGVVTRKYLQKEIDSQHVRADLLKIVSSS